MIKELLNGSFKKRVGDIDQMIQMFIKHDFISEIDIDDEMFKTIFNLFELAIAIRMKLLLSSEGLSDEDFIRMHESFTSEINILVKKYTDIVVI